MQINKRQLKKWIAALDSGEYKQGRYKFQQGSRHCLFGVACRVLIKPKDLHLSYDNELFGASLVDQPCAPEWLKEINTDFQNLTGFNLMGLNDSQANHFAFSEIATLLELVYIHKILD